MSQVTHKLNTGASIPAVGLGTWKSDPGQVKAAVSKALEAGYKHIDCAHAYMNEGEVGEALQEAFAKGTKREDVFVTSKLWNKFHKAEDVAGALDVTLKNLKLEFVDLYLMHWPVALSADASAPPQDGDVLDVPIKETWQAMEALVATGKVKAIGVSNFTIKKLEDLLSYAKVVPAANQIELHPYWRQTELIDYCNSKGIHVTAYSPLGSPDRPKRMVAENEPSLLESPVVKAIGDAHGKSTGQVLIRWAVQRGTSVLPKSATPSRIVSNLDVFSWELTADEMKQLNEFSPQQRLLTGNMWITPSGPYKSLAQLWDEE